MIYSFYQIAALVILIGVICVIAVIHYFFDLLIQFIVPILVSFVITVAVFLIYQITQAVVIVSLETVVVEVIIGFYQTIKDVIFVVQIKAFLSVNARACSRAGTGFVCDIAIGIISECV